MLWIHAIRSVHVKLNDTIESTISSVLWYSSNQGLWNGSGAALIQPSLTNNVTQLIGRYLESNETYKQLSFSKSNDLCCFGGLITISILSEF